jgi:hypothetical protein
MPYIRASKKPEPHSLYSPFEKRMGQPTRGKTASNRLRRVDNFILLYEPSLLTRTDGPFAQALFVDLDYGFDARTTLESAARFRRVNPDLKILGVEIDKEREEVLVEGVFGVGTVRANTAFPCVYNRPICATKL